MTENVNINSPIDELYKNGLITNRCKKVLNALKMKDAFDVMTTNFPPEGTKFPRKGKNLILDSKIKNEINSLVNTLYKL